MRVAREAKMDEGVTVVEASAEDRPLLTNLLQLYLYDFTDVMPWDVEATGRFGERALDGCWTDPRRHPFLFRVGGYPAGFAIVDRGSRLTGDAGVWDMGEFFVLRRYRRRGVGEGAARALFGRFPGPWEVRQLAANAGATAFWRSVIGRYTGGRFEELGPAVAGRGPVQRFSSPPGRPPAAGSGGAAPPPVRLRRYREADRAALAGLMDAFQDELAAMDDLGRLWRGPGFGERAAAACLREVGEGRGLLVLAVSDGPPAGFAAGVVEDLTVLDRLTARAGRSGRVTELYVRPEARRRGIARRLLARLDRHFAHAGCDTVRTAVFAPNRAARALYARLGFVARDVELLRPFRPSPGGNPTEDASADGR
jgi:predicted acetyltransferase